MYYFFLHSYFAGALRKIPMAMQDRFHQSTVVMNAKSISRYDLKWFVPLDQLESLDTKGIGRSQFSHEKLSPGLILWYYKNCSIAFCRLNFTVNKALFTVSAGYLIF